MIREGGGKIPPGLSRVQGHLRTKFQPLHPRFRYRLVQRRCRRHNRKSRYTGNRCGGRPNRKLPNLNLHAINKPPTATPLKMDNQRALKFGNIRWNSSSISPAARDVVTSHLYVCDIYFRYSTTSYNTKLRTA